MMVTTALQAAVLTWMLACLLAAAPPRPAAPLWTLPPLPRVGYAGASVRVNMVVDLQPVEPAPELWALDAAVARDVAALDRIEAAFRAELAWIEASALIWLGGDLDTEHTLITLTDEGCDKGLCSAVLTPVGVE